MIPNFFIVGAAKSGTSSLYHYLRLHPDIHMSSIKEPHFLCSHHFPKQFTGPGDEGFSASVVRNQADYFKLFEPPTPASVLGEGSVYYLYYPDAAEKIQVLNPNAKIVILLRNPVERAFSAYMHAVRDGRETLSFEKALEAEPKRKQNGYQPLWWYREIGLYSEQVQRYLERFPAGQIRIFLYEELQETPRLVKACLKFLGVDETVPIDTSIRHNVSGVPKSRAIYNFFARPNPLKNFIKPLFPENLARKLGERAKGLTLKKDKIPGAVKADLQRYYKQDIQKLETLIERDLSKWLAS